MNGYKKGVGNWDDDFDGNWHGDNPPQPKVIEPYSDNWIMPFGKHKGKMLLQVPGAYLLWLIENSNGIDPRLKAYIEDNLDSINKKQH